MRPSSSSAIPRAPAPLGDGGGQRPQGVSVIRQAVERVLAASRAPRRRGRPIHLKISETPDLADPDVLVGQQIEQCGAGDDPRFRAPARRQQHVGLRAAADPLRQRPIAAGIGDVLGRRRHDGVEALSALQTSLAAAGLVRAGSRQGRSLLIGSLANRLKAAWGPSVWIIFKAAPR